jgi:hypothetical protein
MISLKNKHFTLILSDDARAKSLLFNKTGEECLYTGEDVPFFTLTQERPFNNEVKLAYPNKETTFKPKSVKQDGDLLTVAFELIDIKAVVAVKTTDEYISFTLKELLPSENEIYLLAMDQTPVYKFRLIGLPVKERGRFGELLNVELDDKIAVNVLANCPEAMIDADKRTGYKILSADCHRDIQMCGVSASIIVNDSDKLLDSIDVLEEDYDLPRGVKSRRNPLINRSILWSSRVSRDTVDEFIKFAKEGGFTMVTMWYSGMFRYGISYDYYGEYVYNEESYPGGDEDLKYVLKRLKEAGIHPGFHILHSHIGTETSYVTPVADHRLNMTRRFTLARPLTAEDTEIYVEENPRGAVMHEKCRVLKFGGELISYEAYTTEWPYKFVGCTRGHFKTNVICHEIGQIGGILDLSEFGGARSVYIDERTSLQDEIADKIAHIYDLGFEYLYFDGSEGTNPPFAYYVPLAQYKVYNKLKNKPLFCECAAKAHFSWHMMSGGNAFDTFPAPMFKEGIVRFPLDEMNFSKNDFTRCNFGWWKYNEELQPDHYEFGTSKAFSVDCPITILFYQVAMMNSNPRRKDMLEALRRWEDCRINNLLSDKKELISTPDKEFTLLIDKNGEYLLKEYEQIEGTPEGLRAFYFEDGGKSCVVYWCDKADKMSFALPISDDVEIKDEYAGADVKFTKDGDLIRVTASDKNYLFANLTKDEIIKAFASAKKI